MSLSPVLLLDGREGSTLEGASQRSGGTAVMSRHALD